MPSVTFRGKTHTEPYTVYCIHLREPPRTCTLARTHAAALLMWELRSSVSASMLYTFRPWVSRVSQTLRGRGVVLLRVFVFLCVCICVRCHVFLRMCVRDGISECMYLCALITNPRMFYVTTPCSFRCGFVCVCVCFG